MSSVNSGYFFTTIPFRAIHDKNLSHAEYRVFSALCSYMNNKTNQCWPSYQALSDRCHLAKRNVMDYVKNLEKKGYITIEKRNCVKKGFKTNVYSIVWDNGERLSPDEIPTEENENDSDDAFHPSDSENHYPSDNHHHQGSANHYHQGSAPHYHPNNTNITTPGEQTHTTRTRAGEDATPLKKTSLSVLDSLDEASPQQMGAPLTLLVEAYNKMAVKCGLSVVKKFDDDRRAALTKRFKEINNDYDEWLRLMVQIMNTPFLVGESSSGWKINFDDILEKKKFRKLIEGGYGGTSKPSARDQLMNEAREMDSRNDHGGGYGNVL